MQSRLIRLIGVVFSNGTVLSVSDSKGMHPRDHQCFMCHVYVCVAVVSRSTCSLQFLPSDGTLGRSSYSTPRISQQHRTLPAHSFSHCLYSLCCVLLAIIDHPRSGIVYNLCPSVHIQYVSK